MELKSLLWTLALAMAPVSELRGAIPYGLAHDIPLGLLLPLCVAANLLPVPLIVLFLRKILAWMQRLGGKPKALAEWAFPAGRHSAAGDRRVDGRARCGADGAADEIRAARHRRRRSGGRRARHAGLPGRSPHRGALTARLRVFSKNT